MFRVSKWLVVVEVSSERVTCKGRGAYFMSSWGLGDCTSPTYWIIIGSHRQKELVIGRNKLLKQILIDSAKIVVALSVCKLWLQGERLALLI